MKRIATLLIALFCQVASGQSPETIADFGGDPFLKTPEIKLTPPRRDAYLNDHFPVRTPSMSPGRIRGGDLPLPHETAKLHPSFFVMGYDNYSVQWVSAHKQKLVEASAKGFVVNVESAAQLQQLRSILKPLTLIAAPGSSFTELWGVKHYPFFVHQGALTQ